MRNAIVPVILLIALQWFALPSHAIGLTTQLVASGFNTPVFLTSPPGDIHRMFVVEGRGGKVKIIKDGVLLPTPFLDILPLITNDNERGLLGFAFHPHYERNGFFYVNYTDLNGDTRVVRYKVSSDPDVADPNSAYEVLFVDQPAPNHNGGMLVFGPDGYLYIGLGDGGGAPGNRSQDLTTDLGKILRIRPRKNQPYTIPPDNPFVGVTGASPRIYSMGWRNPWRFSFDARTGDMWVADVGQNLWEEIDFKPASSTGGENYGWPVAEANSCFGNPTADCGGRPGFTRPIYMYDHTAGASITGGYVYRGPIKDLQGTYFFADFSRARIWSMRYDGTTISEFQERTTELDIPGSLDIRGIASFGEDAQRNLYILDWSQGEVFKIVKVPGMPAVSDYWKWILALFFACTGVACILKRQIPLRRLVRARARYL